MVVVLVDTSVKPRHATDAVNQASSGRNMKVDGAYLATMVFMFVIHQRQPA
jgi:hypothetical protein